ncbi:MAG: DUF3419 family protein [Ignavibacteriales bacterium]|nr:DUF3419 family protein [Ignavibacteriales bacterium]
MKHYNDTHSFKDRISRPIIRYAQCWEDPRTLMSALAVTADDDVLSIASAGDNSFALLLNNPRALTAIDTNPAQISLTELKMRGIEHLDYEEFVGFVGACPCSQRQKLYRSLRASLSEASRRYWDTETAKINRGIIHSGKFERYFRVFRRFVLPLIHKKETIKQLLNASSVEAQRSMYEAVWNNRRWRALFRVFFSKLILGAAGRDPSFFRFVKLDTVADELLARTEHGFTEVPLRDNFFVEYIMTGEFKNLEAVHPYLAESNFSFLKQHVQRMKLCVASLEEFLVRMPDGEMSKFNLSDVFEYMSDESAERVFKELVRVSRRDSRLAFWTLFVPRNVPRSLQQCIQPRMELSRDLYFQDRTFFYGNFACWDLNSVPRVGGGNRGFKRKNERGRPWTFAL